MDILNLLLNPWRTKERKRIKQALRLKAHQPHPTELINGSYGVRAAVFFMSLPPERSAALFSELGPEAVQSITLEITRLPYVTSDDRLRLVNELLTPLIGHSISEAELTNGILEATLVRNWSIVVADMKQQLALLREREEKAGAARLAPQIKFLLLHHSLCWRSQTRLRGSLSAMTRACLLLLPYTTLLQEPVYREFLIREFLGLDRNSLGADLQSMGVALNRLAQNDTARFLRRLDEVWPGWSEEPGVFLEAEAG